MPHFPYQTEDEVARSSEYLSCGTGGPNPRQLRLLHSSTKEENEHERAQIGPASRIITHPKGSGLIPTTSGPFMINESFHTARPRATRKGTTAPANPTRLPPNAFVIMALRLMGTSTCRPALQPPAPGEPEVWPIARTSDPYDG